MKCKCGVELVKFYIDHCCDACNESWPVEIDDDYHDPKYLAVGSNDIDSIYRTYGHPELIVLDHDVHECDDDVNVIVKTYVGTCKEVKG